MERSSEDRSGGAAASHGDGSGGGMGRDGASTGHRTAVGVCSTEGDRDPVDDGRGEGSRAVRGGRRGETGAL